MLRDSWRSILTWSSVLSVVIFITGILLTPNVERNIRDMFFGFVSLFIGSFFMLAIFLLILTRVKMFMVAGSQDRVLMIIAFLLALAYVLPKVIANFKK